MSEKNEVFEKIEVSHTFIRNGNLLEITPELSLDSPESTTLIASYFVDSFEMIESARFSVQKGKNHLPFMQKVKIFNPLIWNPCTVGEPALYELKTVFYKNGAPYYIILQMSGLKTSSLDIKDGKKVLLVNGKIMEGRLYRGELEMPVKDLVALGKEKGEIFVIVGGKAPDAERNLEMCDRAGFVAVLDVTDMTEEEYKRLKHHPSICLHIASSGTSSSAVPGFPFATTEELYTQIIS